MKIRIIHSFYNLKYLTYRDSLTEDNPFKIQGDVTSDTTPSESHNPELNDSESSDIEMILPEDEGADDIVIISDSNEKKRSRSEADEQSVRKKRKVLSENQQEEMVIID